MNWNEIKKENLVVQPQKYLDQQTKVVKNKSSNNYNDEVDEKIRQEIFEEYRDKSRLIQTEIQNELTLLDIDNQKSLNLINIKQLLQRDFKIKDYVSINEKGQRYIRNGFVSIIISHVILRTGYKVWNDCWIKGTKAHLVINFANKKYSPNLKSNQFQIRDTTIKNIIKREVYELAPNILADEVDKYPDLFHKCMIKETRDRLIATGLIKYGQFMYQDQEKRKETKSRIWFYTLADELVNLKTKKLEFSKIWRSISFRKIRDKISFKFLIRKQERDKLSAVQNFTLQQKLQRLQSNLKSKAIWLKTNKKFCELSITQKELWLNWANKVFKFNI